MKRLAGLAVMGALVCAPSAQAAAPILTAAGQTSGHLTASWSLPTGVQPRIFEAAMSPEVSTDGAFFFENVLAGGAFDTLEDGQTSYVGNGQTAPGTYYVHVSGTDEACAYLSCPGREYSSILTVTVPCRVPRVRGLRLAAARGYLRSAGCRYRALRVRSRVRRGHVVSTSPAFRNTTSSVVVVRVSRGLSRPSLGRLRASDFRRSRVTSFQTCT